MQVSPKHYDDKGFSGMDISISDFGEIGKRVVLVGKLDIAGAEQIDLPLAAVAGSRGNIVVDMARVSFISSIGIRHLVMAAKTVARRSGKLVLLAPNPLVTDVLVNAGLTNLLPIVRSDDEARAALAGTAGA
jgi:anti-anti-sigma factor